MSRRPASSRSRALVAVLLGGGAVLAAAPPAAAHVGVTASTTAAGAYAVLTVSVPHGCDGSPTTAVTISMPEGVNAVTPTRSALWTVTKEVVVLDPPVVDGHGNEVTERVETVTYRTDDPLPEGYRDAFELSLQVPDAEGETLLFPTVQTCVEGESAWIEVPADGQDADDLDLPAPGFTITAATGDGHHGAGEGDDEHATDDATDDATDGAADGAADDRALSPATSGALALGVLGTALGGAGLLAHRRRR
ncbi:MAG: hypothetical protein CMH83_21585 [Nocardioides sp.]|nr:hypothetical protein [Nocardioides sp.]